MAKLATTSLQEDIIDLLDEAIQPDVEQASHDKAGRTAASETEQQRTEWTVEGRLRQYGDHTAVNPGDLVLAEVTHHTDLRALPGVLVVTPPFVERFRAFRKLYNPGMDVTVEVVGSTPPGSLQQGLQVRERVTGLDIVVPTKELSVFSDPVLLSSIRIGAIFSLRVDSIDDRHEEIVLTGLPRLEPYLQGYRLGGEDVTYSATVVSITYNEQNIFVLVMLDDSRPDQGLILSAKIRMFRELFEQNGVLRLPYREGAKVHVNKLRCRNDVTLRNSVPMLTRGEAAALEQAGITLNHKHQLSGQGGMSWTTYEQLIHAAETAPLSSALRELFQASNELFGDRIITDLERYFPVGERVQGTVTYISSGGIKLALKGGVVGHVARDEITWWNQRARVEEFADVGDVCEGKVLKVDVGRQTVHLSLRKALGDSWQEAITNTYPLSKKVEGVIERIQPYGAFVMLEPGLDGLIPLGGMRNFHGQYVARPTDVVQVGDRVQVRVKAHDMPKQNISLELVKHLGQAASARRTAQTKNATEPPKEADRSREPLGWDDPKWPWTEGENAIVERKRPEPPTRPESQKRAPLKDRPNPLEWSLTWQ